MTSELKCPFCGEELQRTYEPEEYWCSNYSCGKPHPFNLQGTKELWTALIQAKQDLEIARKALEELRGYKRLPPQTPWEIIAEKALAQIEHKV